jgi:hypothetical protein
LTLQPPLAILKRETRHGFPRRIIQMPYCPECQYEYRVGVRECPDCNERLVEMLPAQGNGPLRPLRLVELYRGHSPEVRILEEALRQEGIPSLVRPAEPLAALVGELVPAMFSQLLISAEDFEERRAVIEDCLQFVGR